MRKIFFQAAFLMLLATPALAQDWTVTRVRGSAEQLMGGRWIELVRGATVLDEQTVRTGADGRVGLSRGVETIELDPGTSLRLHEGEGKFTSVEQSSGSIIVDVERRNVQHFSVQTPFLAAVVKGTKFHVSVSRTSANVEVERGVVQVQDSLNDLVVDIARGQQAEVSRTDPLLVSGSGQIAIFTFDGLRVVNGTADTPADNDGNAIDASTSEQSTSNGAQKANNAVSASESRNASEKGVSNASAKGAGANGNGKNGNAGGNGNNGNGNNGNGNAGASAASTGNGNGNNGNGNGGGNGSANNGNGGGNGNGNGNNGNGNGNGGGDGTANNGNGGSNGNAGGNNGNGNGGGNNGNGNGNGGGNK